MKVILKKTIADKLDELIEKHGKENIECFGLDRDEFDELFLLEDCEFVYYDKLKRQYLDDPLYRGLKLKIVE